MHIAIKILLLAVFALLISGLVQGGIHYLQRYDVYIGNHVSNGATAFLIVLLYLVMFRKQPNDSSVSE